jgi:hypothetical protein
MKKEIEILGKIICYGCGINCDLQEVKITEADIYNSVGRFVFCGECLEKEREND